ncbi:helix-turn-helix transcriptional regulator [Streptacidiphilus carbonis]|uniref:helix-turn-helix transcriptional regulator n=1 Tax=Streptacidiphilus carbonis TaxID=105422 RepID=UPI0009FC0A29|nr:helix-turn-helix transcriptional regulator [Streptacidiphilus carbonis]
MLGTVERISVSPRFVGRNSELAALEAALRRAEAGLPQAVLIGGEAGVGKTRLLEEFQRSALARGAVVAVGGCLEVGAEGLPYAPFASLLRRLHREFGEELAQAAEGNESSLARLLPDFGEAPPEAHDAFARARLFEHTARLFERLTVDRALVLAVEDLHWSDRSTRELLAYLVRTLQGARVVVLATYRSDDLHRRHPVRPFLAELERLRTVQRFELPRLGRAEVARQLAGILHPRIPGEDLVRWVYDRSEGNPFFVEELAVSEQQGAGRCLTDSLRDLLLVRVEAMPEESQGILRVLAEGGSAVEHRLLAAVAGHPEDELTEVLRTAVGANIIQPSADMDGYCYRHALVREAVSDDLMPGERSRINRRYAGVLAEHPDLVAADQRAARLADYWYHARDAALALPAALEAGLQARRRNAFAEQLRMLERALELWDDVPEQVLAGLVGVEPTDSTYPVCTCPPGAAHGCDRLRMTDVLAQAAVAAMYTGEHDRGLRFIKKALRIVDENEDPQRAAWFLMQRGRAVRYRSGGTEREDISRALKLVGDGPPTAVLAHVLNRLATEGTLDHASPEDLVTARRAAEVARAVGARATELHARLTLGSLYRTFDDHERAEASFEGIAEEAAATDDLELQSKVYINLSHHYESEGRSARAVDAARAGLALIRRNGMAAYSGTIMLGNLAEPLLSLGQLEEAERLLAEEPFGAGREAHRDFLERLRGELALMCGDTARAAALLETSLAIGANWQPQKYLPTAALAIRIACQEGRFGDARAELAAVLDKGLARGYERNTWPLLFHAATAEADGFELPGSAAERPAALQRIRAAAAGLSTVHPLSAAWAPMLSAELARAERDDSTELWLTAAEAVRGLESPGPRAVALYRAAERLAADGDRGAAAEAAAEALELAERQGELWLQQSLRQLVERAGLRTGQPARPAAETPGEGGASAFHLTPRELGVLRLVALGRTNRQIAEELYISPKTASVHVSNILAKLEVTGRGEAAALAHRLHLVAPR